MRKLLSFLMLVIMVFATLTFVFAQNTTVTSGQTPTIDIFGAAGILAVAIPFVIGALKKYVKLPTSWCPAVAFLLGGIGGLLAFLTKFNGGLTMLQCIIAGIAIGGTSSGLYDLAGKVRAAMVGSPE